MRRIPVSSSLWLISERDICVGLRVSAWGFRVWWGDLKGEGGECANSCCVAWSYNVVPSAGNLELAGTRILILESSLTLASSFPYSITSQSTESLRKKARQSTNQRDRNLRRIRKNERRLVKLALPHIGKERPLKDQHSSS